jgi:hypothetical protein
MYIARLMKCSQTLVMPFIYRSIYLCSLVFLVISREQHWKMTLGAAYRDSVQKEVISDLKGENKFLSTEIWGSIIDL